MNARPDDILADPPTEPLRGAAHGRAENHEGSGNPIAQKNADDLITPNYTQGRYEAEKALGIRNQKTGFLGLKKLKPRHYLILNKYLAGKRPIEIANELGMQYPYVVNVLKDPLMEVEITAAMEAHRNKLRVLQGKAVDAVEVALSSENVGTQLRGVDRFVKMADALDVLKDGKETAEDVARRIINQVNVQVNVER